MVVGDTSVWIPFFTRPSSSEKQAIDALIDADKIVMVGIVLAELIQGCRAQRERAELKDALLALPYLEATQSTWIRAGELSGDLLRRGITLPMPDLIIASLAIEHHCSVYSLDAHFQKIPDVRLYRPASV